MINRKKIVKYFCALGAVISAIYFWLIISGIVNTTNPENWGVPIIVFSVMFVLWALVIILEDSQVQMLLLGIALVFPGIIFTHNVFFIGISFLSIVVLYLGAIWVHESIDARVKLNIWMSLRLGRKLFVVAITAVIVIGFLMPILLSGKERVLPVISISENHMKLIGRAMAVIDPNFNFEDLSTMTTDEYILKEHQKFIDNRTKEQRKLIDSEIKTILLSGRSDISRLANRKVRGEEKIMSVFIGIINNKINNYFNTEISQSSDFAPLFFSALSFFAIFSIGSFITTFLTFLVTIIFRILVLIKLVEISQKSVEVEVIN